MECPRCGAPLEADDEACEYCGLVTEYGERLREERRQREEEAERLRNMPVMPFTEMHAAVIAYVLTLGFYSSFWFITRSVYLNRMKTELKFPLWAAVIYPAVCFCFMFLPVGHESIGLAETPAKILFAVSSMLAYVMSVQLALRAQKILQERVPEIAPSVWMLALFGSLYLQYSVNRMIRAGSILLIKEE